MKGIIFTSFATFVEQEYSLLHWQSLLDTVTTESAGVYISTKQYPDSELMALINQLATDVDTTLDNLERAFGRWCFPHLYKMASDITRDVDGFYNYLLAVDSLIHVEVRKLYPGAQTPKVTTNMDDNKIVVRYSSPRKLCYFCEGLLLSCAEHFNLKLSIEQSLCMHRGDEYCELEMTDERQQ